MEPVCKDGLDTFAFEGETALWNWWKSITKYGRGEEVDLVVLTDGEENWQFAGFPLAESTVWTQRELAKLQNGWNDYGKVIVIVNAKQLTLRSGKKCEKKLVLKRWPDVGESVEEGTPPASPEPQAEVSSQEAPSQPSLKQCAAPKPPESAPSAPKRSKTSKTTNPLSEQRPDQAGDAVYKALRRIRQQQK